MPCSLLPHRDVIRIGGADRCGFLQGLVSNDVNKATATQAVYGALLTPQGKFLHDMFILEYEDAFLIDCERGEDLLRRLSAYKLRSKVTLENLSDRFDVWAVWDEDYRAPLSFVDPRLPELGLRVFLEKNKAPDKIKATHFAAYDALRYEQGVAEGNRDLDVGKSTLAEGNFDFLNGIDWKKGCYIGQELTARMHYRGLAKKRLFPVRIEGDSVPFGAILDNDSGEMRGSCGGVGLAVVKIETVQQAINQQKSLTYGQIRLWPRIPDWMKV